MAKLWQNIAKKQKGFTAIYRKPLILMARPARFERATYGFVVNKTNDFIEDLKPGA